MPTNEKKHWSEEEEKHLITLYFDHKIQAMLDGTCRDRQIYNKLSDQLNDLGIEGRSGVSIKIKINNLKAWYRKHSDRVGKPGKSGGARKKRSAIFTMLDEFMSEKPQTKPKVVMESASNGGLPHIDDVESDDSNDSFSDDDDDDDHSQMEDESEERMSTPITESDEEDVEDQPSTSTAENDDDEHDRPSTSAAKPSTSAAKPSTNAVKHTTAAKPAPKKKGKSRRKVPQYEKAMKSMSAIITESTSEADNRLEQAIMESIRSQQEWEERQRAQDREAARQFRDDLLKAEKDSMNQLGGILQSLFGGSQAQPPHQNYTHQIHAPTPSYQATYGQPSAATSPHQSATTPHGQNDFQYETPRRAVRDESFQVRRIQPEDNDRNMFSIFSETSDILNN